MASFETQRRDQSARQLMVATRRVVEDRLAAAQQRARHSAHHRNMPATRKTAEPRQEEEDRARATAVLARASQREHQ
jgi:hypothetical protein